MRLFENGVLLQEWNESNGKKNGNCTQYELGMVKQIQNWENLASDGDLIRILNTKAGSRVEFIDRTSGVVVYRGGFTKSWLRHGLGIEYNKDSGEMEYECLWENGKKKKYLREFIGDKMIEYSSSSNNLTLSETCPVYYGEYFYVESTGEFLRHGIGYEIESNTGYATREGFWKFGDMMSSVDLDKGWYDGSATSKTKKEPVTKIDAEVKKESEPQPKVKEEPEPQPEVKEEPESQPEVKEESESQPEAKKEPEPQPDVSKLSKKQRKKLAKQEHCRIPINNTRIPSPRGTRKSVRHAL